MLWVVGQPQSRETHAIRLFFGNAFVVLQRFNAILISKTFVEAGNAPDLWLLRHFVFNLYYRGYKNNSNNNNSNNKSYNNVYTYSAVFLPVHCCCEDLPDSFDECSASTWRLPTFRPDQSTSALNPRTA